VSAELDALPVDVLRPRIVAEVERRMASVVHAGITSNEHMSDTPHGPPVTQFLSTNMVIRTGGAVGVPDINYQALGESGM